MTRILVRPPALEDLPSWRAFGWRAEPDPIGLADEHARFRATLASAGVEVIEAHGEPGNLDSIYVYDPVLVTPQGAILLQPGKAGRRGEPEALVGDLPLPVLGRLEGDELAEGGDTVWLDERTLLVGHTYRTNRAGIDAIRRLLPGGRGVRGRRDLAQGGRRPDLPHIACRFRRLLFVVEASTNSRRRRPCSTCS